MRYEFVKLNDDIVNQLIELSRVWVDEGCSCGMVENTIKDIHEPLLVAYDNEKIVGYIFGHSYVEEKKKAYIEIGTKCFEIDELFVLKEYRSKGVGKALFKMFEEKILKDYEYYTLATSTKDYKKILNFYVDEVGMDFHSAFLIKKNK